MRESMFPARVALLGLCLWLLTVVFAGPAAAQGNRPIVRLFFFYSESCDHCQKVIQEVLPPLWDQYGGQLEIRFFELNVDHNYTVLLKLESQYRVSGAGWPEVFIGRDMLSALEVEQKLAGVVAQYLAEGGCDWPSDDWAVGPAPVVPRQPTPTPGPSPTPGPTFTPPATIPPGTVVIVPTPWPTWTPKVSAPPGTAKPTPTIKTCAHCGDDTPTPTPRPTIHMAYFFDPSCPECQRAERDLAYLLSHTPDLALARFNIEEPRSKGIAAVLGERLNIPREKRLATPMIVVGQDYLATTDVTLRAMQSLIEKYRAQGGARPSWEGIRDEEGIIALVQLFEGFSPLAVLGAGLVDGLNPCAFATIIFFVSYLAVTGRKGRDVLLVGGTFTLAVFLTYLLIGAGIFTFLKGLGFLPALARIVYGGTALVCAVFGALSVYDLYKIRRGQSAEMALQLPGFLKRRTRELIREGSLGAETKGRLGAFVAMAAFAGFGISLLEFVCTGQVYLPTIVFITGVPALAAQGYLYLVLYNLMFVTPLIGVFLLAYFGANSQQLAAAMNRRLVLVKALTAALFFVLAIWLVSLVVW